MKLIIVHYHLRPGGVRRVIELAAAPLMCRFAGAIEGVVLAVGEEADQKWKRLFRRQWSGTPVEFFVEPSFKYLSEQTLPTSQIRKRLQAALDKLFTGAEPGNTLVWAHNPGIGRNLLLTQELTSACAASGFPLIMHHHDWWFENRWRRWPEMRRIGFRTLGSVAQAIFSEAPSVYHLAINRSDAVRLQRHLTKRARWAPNLIERGTLPSVARVQRARAWLQAKIGGRPAPVWILPCRFLRRKDIGEALLLTRWLRPAAWLVTTGGASSADEQSYFDRLSDAARRHRWQFRPALLRGNEANKPGVSELLAASEVVLLTSIQEGFGLPYLEAAAACRPLIARSIPNVAPDLERFGFHFPQYYREISIEPSLFDWDAERKRQTHLFQTWRRRLPRPVAEFVGGPVLLAPSAQPRPVAFSRLSLSAQLEVLSKPAAFSYELCASLNPFLALWRKRAEQGLLQSTPWPRKAEQWLSGKAYARHFAEIAATRVSRLAGGHQPKAGAAAALQKDFLRAKLHTEHLFPLLWATST